jgi:hypothetical protein
MGIRVKTVGQFIEALKGFNADTPITVTWEGVFRDAIIYRGVEGDCIVDADNGFYEHQFSDGSMGEPPKRVGDL